MQKHNGVNDLQIDYLEVFRRNIKYADIVTSRNMISLIYRTGKDDDRCFISEQFSAKDFSLVMESGSEIMVSRYIADNSGVLKFDFIFDDIVSGDEIRFLSKKSVGAKIPTIQELLDSKQIVPKEDGYCFSVDFVDKVMNGRTITQDEARKELNQLLDWIDNNDKKGRINMLPLNKWNSLKRVAQGLQLKFGSVEVIPPINGNECPSVCIDVSDILGKISDRCSSETIKVLKGMSDFSDEVSLEVDYYSENLIPGFTLGFCVFNVLCR